MRIFRELLLTLLVLTLTLPVSSVGCRSDWRTNFSESDAIRSLFSSLVLTAILRSGQHSVLSVSAKAVLQILATF